MLINRTGSMNAEAYPPPFRLGGGGLCVLGFFVWAGGMLGFLCLVGWFCVCWGFFNSQKRCAVRVFSPSGTIIMGYKTHLLLIAIDTA